MTTSRLHATSTTGSARTTSGSGAAEPSYDAVIDFEPVGRGPDAIPAWALLPGLTCDRVHPNQAGYSAIANAIPLDVFN